MAPTRRPRGISGSPRWPWNSSAGGLTAVELHPNVVLRADALPSSTRHSTVTILGTNYTIRDLLPMANTQFKRWLLAEALG